MFVWRIGPAQTWRWFQTFGLEPRTKLVVAEIANNDAYLGEVVGEVGGGTQNESRLTLMHKPQ